MSKIIILIEPAEGHFNPFAPIIKSLVARGHELVCITGERFQTRVEALDCRFIPLVAAWDPKDQQWYDFFPELRHKKGLGQIKFYLKHILYAQIPDTLKQLQGVLDEFAADVVLCDTFMLAGNWITELGGPPSVRLSILPLSLPDKNSAPFGLGLLPSDSSLSRLRNALLQFIFTKLIFKDVQTHINQIRKQLSLPPFSESFFIQGYKIPSLVLHTSVPSFEYPRATLPDNFQFIGPVLMSADPEYTLPEGWAKSNRELPVVLINQGTIANNPAELILPAIEALQQLPVKVLIVSVTEAELPPLADNMYAQRYVPYANLLPHIDIMISNGGFGATQHALAEGIPVIIAGATEDKMEVAARVEYSAAGINLRQQNPTAHEIKAAVQRVLNEPEFKQKALELQADYAKYDAPKLAVAAIEHLINENKIA
ncbi:MAG: hypothetical protein GQ582_02525 [Methyloprofundus sp.]|nr:hypothetical protein [Methyloprofundus sp.]